MENVYVTMRDGVRLAVDIFLPEKEGRYPALLSTSPYMKDIQRKPPALGHAIESGATSFYVPRAMCMSSPRGAALASRRGSAVLGDGERTGRLRSYRMDRRAAVVQRQGWDDRRLLLELDPVRRGHPSATASEMHSASRTRPPIFTAMSVSRAASSTTVP